MGMDIHIFLVNKDTGKTFGEDLYDGRCREWFNNLMHQNDPVYEFLNTRCGIPECITSGEIKEDYDENNGFGFSYICAEEYLNWIEEYRPELDAGWVSKYDAWQYIKRGITPIDTWHYLPEDARIEDYQFIEFIDKYDSNINVRANMLKTGISDFSEYYVVYYFDN